MSPSTGMFLLIIYLAFHFKPTHARNRGHPCGQHVTYRRMMIPGPVSLIYFDCSIPWEKNLMLCPTQTVFEESLRKCVHDFYSWRKSLEDLTKSVTKKDQLMEMAKKYMKPQLLDAFKQSLTLSPSDKDPCSSMCHQSSECIVPFEDCLGFYDCSNSTDGRRVSCVEKERFDASERRCVAEERSSCSTPKKKWLFCSGAQMDECLNNRSVSRHDCIFSMECMTYRDCSREPDKRLVQCYERRDAVCELLFTNECQDLPGLMDESTSDVSIAPYGGGTFVEGNEVSVTCSWNITSFERVAWLVDGKEIEQFERVTVRTKERTSTITFHPILKSDQGNLTCSVEYGIHFHKTDQVFLEVDWRVLARITPSFSAVRAETDVNFQTFTCNITISNSIYKYYDPSLIFWNVDGLTVSTTDFKLISIEKLPLKGASSVQCCVETEFGSICSPPLSNVTTYAYDNQINRTCAKETIDGLVWEETRVGRNVTLPCPNLSSGRMVRTCLGDGTWGDKDDDDCLIIEMDLLSKELLSLNATMNSSRLALLSQRLPNINSTNNFEILKNMSAILFRMSSLRKGAGGGRKEATMETKNVLGSLVGVLQSKAWRSGLPLKRPSLQLVQTLNVYSAHRWQDVAFTISFISANNELEFERNTLSNKDLEVMFPNPMKIKVGKNKIKVFKGNLFKNLDENTTIPIGASILKGVTEVMQENNNVSKINSDLVSMDVVTSSSDQLLTEFTLEHLRNLPGYTPSCVYWKFTNTLEGYWSSEGCMVTNESHAFTTCRCTHLTNFAILFSPTPASERDNIILSIISIIGCTISLVALFLTVILYIVKWRLLRSKRAVLLVALCCSLIISNITFLAGVNQTSDLIGCRLVAVLLHLFFLGSFFMMFLLAIHLFISVFFVFFVFTKKHIVVMLILGWLATLVVVATSMGVTNLRGYGGASNCWLSLEEGVLWAFVGPALFIVLVNIMVAIAVLTKICSAKMSQINLKRSKWMSAAQNIVVLNPLLGLTWVFGVLSVNQELVIFQYIFAITNSLQGLFIFLLHGLCLKKNLTNQSKKVRQDKKTTDRHNQANKFGSSMTPECSTRDVMRGENYFVLKNETRLTSAPTLKTPLQRKISSSEDSSYSTEATNVNSSTAGEQMIEVKNTLF